MIQKAISTAVFGQHFANIRGAQRRSGPGAGHPTMATRRPRAEPKEGDDVEPKKAKSPAKTRRPSRPQASVPDPFVGLAWSTQQIAEGRRLLAAQADGLMQAHKATEAVWQARLTDMQATQAAEQQIWEDKCTRLSTEIARLRSRAESDNFSWGRTYPLGAILHDRFVETICDGNFPEPPFYWPLVLKWRHFFLNDEGLRDRLATELRLTDEVVFGDRVVRAYLLMDPASAEGEGADTVFRQEDLDLAEQLLLHFGVPDFMIRRGMWAFEGSVAHEEDEPSPP